MQRPCRASAQPSRPRVRCTLRRASATFVALLLVGALSGTAEAQSFSADIVTIGKTGRASEKPGKLSTGDGKVRIETPDLPDGYFIMDSGAGSAYFVRPAQTLFMDAKETSLLTQLLVPLDPSDPCAQWQAMAKIAGASEAGEWRCEKLGDEQIGDRSTVKLRAISPRGRSLIAWIDIRLRFLIRMRDEAGGGIDLANVEEKPQPNNSFAIPARYSKFDPQKLLERIKQSDVWVEPPK